MVLEICHFQLDLHLKNNLDLRMIWSNKYSGKDVALVHPLFDFLLHVDLRWFGEMAFMKCIDFMLYNKIRLLRYRFCVIILRLIAKYSVFLNHFILFSETITLEIRIFLGYEAFIPSGCQLIIAIWDQFSIGASLSISCFSFHQQTCGYCTGFNQFYSPNKSLFKRLFKGVRPFC